MSLKQEALVGTELTLEQRLLPIVQHRQELKAQIAEIEDQVKDLSDAIADAMLGAGLDKINVGAYACRFSAGTPRKTLDKLRLVELGVSTEILEQATKISESKPFLDVRRKA